MSSAFPQLCSSIYGHIFSQSHFAVSNFQLQTRCFELKGQYNQLVLNQVEPNSAPYHYIAVSEVPYGLMF